MACIWSKSNLSSSQLYSNMSFYLIHFYFSALDERNTTLEELDFGNFGYGWMDGRVASYNLPPDLEELVNEVKEAGKFKLEFQDFRSSRRLTQEQT